MPTDEFRRHGYAVVDQIAEYLDAMETMPVLSQVPPGWLTGNLPASPPRTGEDFADVLDDVPRLILPAVTHWNHPNFHGLFGTAGSSVGILADMFATAFDMKAMLWRTAPASAELESVVLDWLRQMLGLSDGFNGIIYDTASVSTMHAIAAARERAVPGIRRHGMTAAVPPLRVYCSEHVHSSIDKACITLGLGSDAVRKIECNDRFEMIAEKLGEAIEEDLAEGFKPICVIPTIGTTSTSSVDPVDAVADICERHGIWMHVDAAYAGSAAILEEKRELFKGWERADSIVVNPHKWLFVPFDLSVLFCRDLDALKNAFSLVAEYLRTTDSDAVRNGMDYGIQLGRRFRAIKLWFAIRYFGVDGMASRLREHCRLAGEFARRIDASDEFELMAPVPFALVCFRAVGSDELNEKLMAAINDSGEAYISHTKLNGKFTLRLSIGSIHVEQRHIRKVEELLLDKLKDLS